MQSVEFECIFKVITVHKGNRRYQLQKGQITLSDTLTNASKFGNTLIYSVKIIIHKKCFRPSWQLAKVLMQFNKCFQQLYQKSILSDTGIKNAVFTQNNLTHLYIQRLYNTCTIYSLSGNFIAALTGHCYKQPFITTISLRPIHIEF